MYPIIAQSKHTMAVIEYLGKYHFLAVPLWTCVRPSGGLYGPIAPSLHSPGHAVDTQAADLNKQILDDSGAGCHLCHSDILAWCSGVPPIWNGIEWVAKAGW